eukprot:Polyplicarium_translucidae@DN2980_c2_g1_i3.p2
MMVKLSLPGQGGVEVTAKWLNAEPYSTLPASVLGDIDTDSDGRTVNPVHVAVKDYEKDIRPYVSREKTAVLGADFLSPATPSQFSSVCKAVVPTTTANRLTADYPPAPVLYKSCEAVSALVSPCVHAAWYG